MKSLDCNELRSLHTAIPVPKLIGKVLKSSDGKVTRLKYRFNISPTDHSCFKLHVAMVSFPLTGKADGQENFQSKFSVPWATEERVLRKEQ